MTPPIHPDAMRYWAQLCIKYAALHPDKLPEMSKLYLGQQPKPQPAQTKQPSA